jgi:hypothetical protein
VGQLDRPGHDLLDLVLALHREVGDVQPVESRPECLTHPDLNGVELAELAALADQHQQRDLVRDRQRAEDVGGVAEAAVLHQQRAMLAAQVGASEDADPFLFTGRAEDVEILVVDGAPEQLGQDRIGDVDDHLDLVRPEAFEHDVRPRHRQPPRGLGTRRLSSRVLLARIVHSAEGTRPTRRANR